MDPCEAWSKEIGSVKCAHEVLMGGNVERDVRSRKGTASIFTSELRIILNVPTPSCLLRALSKDLFIMVNPLYLSLS